MKTFSRKEASEKFDQFWKDMKEEWFKVEVLQDYTGEDDSLSLRAWKEGDKTLALKLLKEELKLDTEWVDINREKSSVKRIRIHIVEGPYHSYLEWEIEAYKLANIPLGGEEVYLLDKSGLKGVNLPDGDFIIFDNKRVIKNTYNEEGRMIKADVYEEGEEIRYFINLKKKLLKSNLVKL